MKNLPVNSSLITRLMGLLALLCLVGASLPDPTRPPDDLLPVGTKLKVSGALQVTAIFIYQDYRYALINGQRAAVGDKIGEYTIINIQHDTVELKGSKDNSMILTLLPKVKAPVSDKGR